jgi:hypothetical protein
MKNKKFTVTIAQLDSHNEVAIDTYLDLQVSSPAGGTETRRHYPNKVQYINKTGLDLQTNIFSSQAEYSGYLVSSTNYDKFTILNNTSVSLTSQSLLPTAYKIVVQNPSGTASADLIIDCIGYQPKGF